MNELQKLFETHVALQMGIAPVEDVLYDANRIFAGMDPEEAKKVKRKFRKAWRKLAKKLAKKAKLRKQDGLALSSKYLNKGEAPTRSQRIARKSLVRNHVEVKAVRLISGTAKL